MAHSTFWTSMILFFVMVMMLAYLLSLPPGLRLVLLG
jgi:hypothetical protein